MKFMAYKSMNCLDPKYEEKHFTRKWEYFQKLTCEPKLTPKASLLQGYNMLNNITVQQYCFIKKILTIDIRNSEYHICGYQDKERLSLDLFTFQRIFFLFCFFKNISGNRKLPYNGRAYQMKLKTSVLSFTYLCQFSL